MFGAILAIGIVGALLISYVSIRAMRFEDRVEITAHRGASGAAPENTLAAIRGAVEQGADWVEIDVQETADGEVVVFHDSDLMRQASIPTKIWQVTSDQLKDIDIGSWFSASFGGERVPRLREVLEYCRGKIRVNIELKYYGHNVALEQRVVELVEQLGMQEQIVIMSLELEGLRRLKALRPNWKCGQLVATKIGDLSRTEMDFLALRADLATLSLIRAARRQAKPVYVWTVNEPGAVSSMISRGVTNIITDRPAVARAVLQRRAAMSGPERLLLEVAEFFGVRYRIAEQ